MALRSVATTDTLETFRTTFNSLGTDVGDLASLSGVSASTIVGAINELATEQYGGFVISDDSSTTTQQIGPNDTLTFTGTSNQITATVSAQDTVTFALASTITGLSSITSGAVQILDNRVLTTDSTNLILQDIIGISSAGAITGVSSFDATTITENSVSKKIMATPIEKIWKKVLNFPRKFTLALFSLFVSNKCCRITPIEISLAIISIVISKKIRLSKWKEIKINKLLTKILSAKRSKFAPKIDSWSKYLAKYPSKKSVQLAIKKNKIAKWILLIIMQKMIGNMRNILDRDIKFGIMKILCQLWSKFHGLQ